MKCPECLAEKIEIAKQILTDKRDKLEKMTHVLLEKEKMDERDFLTILALCNSKKENESKT
jgi:ATP-dependent Zn protease